MYSAVIILRFRIQDPEFEPWNGCCKVLVTVVCTILFLLDIPNTISHRYMNLQKKWCGKEGRDKYMRTWN
jgi:hypothetical protein